jgi:hypothetical protein
MMPMVDAPKDGTPIIAFFGDFSGCRIISWGAYSPDLVAEWLDTDLGECVGLDLIGWIPCPVIPLKIIIDRLMTDARGVLAS